MFDAIAARPHSPSSRPRRSDWVGKPLMDLAGRSQAQAGAIVAQWLQSKTLVPGEPFKTGGRNDDQDCDRRSRQGGRHSGVHTHRKPAGNRQWLTPTSAHLSAQVRAARM